MIVSFDIETAPLPLDELSDAQRRRLRLEYKDQSRRHPERSVTDLVVRAQSFHPYLSFVCAIACAWSDNGQLKTWSESAYHPQGERDVLKRFWTFARKTPADQWVSFNGKKFDAEHLMTRSLVCNTPVTAKGLIDQYPYSFAPHCDLANIWRNKWMRLDDACELMDVVSRPAPLDDGGEVWKEVDKATSDTDMEKVETYCACDAEKTLRLYYRVAGLHPDVACESFDPRDEPEEPELSPNETGRVGSKMTEKRRSLNGAFHSLGVEFYGKDRWDEMRKKMVEHTLEKVGITGKTSSNDLTDSQMKELCDLMNKRIERYGTYDEMIEARQG